MVSTESLETVDDPARDIVRQISCSHELRFVEPPQCFFILAGIQVGLPQRVGHFGSRIIRALRLVEHLSVKLCRLIQSTGRQQPRSNFAGSFDSDPISTPGVGRQTSSKRPAQPEARAHPRVALWPIGPGSHWVTFVVVVSVPSIPS